MTATIERAAPAAADPRELVSPELFRTLAAYVAKHQEVTLAYAERMVSQMLVWMRAVADNPHVRLAMDETVDPAWHAFILHSEDYAAFCDRMFGRYLHHVPPGPGTSHTAAEVHRTMPALEATGYPVDTEFWVGAKPCCPPNPCVVAVEPCHTGTGAPPPAVSTRP
ncbi:hypothetical protein AB0K34_04805 [Actinomadura sp. NPDC049382]|uniref:hypothetical protein n=1 Tax=Actinomadura sp. NPDC049382 TaxID=3158220 RepID=UPI0034145F75